MRTQLSTLNKQILGGLGIAAVLIGLAVSVPNPNQPSTVGQPAWRIAADQPAITIGQVMSTGIPMPLSGAIGPSFLLVRLTRAPAVRGNVSDTARFQPITLG